MSGQRHVWMLGLLALVLAGCNGSDTKPDGEPKVKIVKVGVPKEEVNRQLTDMFRRGFAHGQGVTVVTMLTSTRNFEAAWETALQNFETLPSLVPYLLGFLDAIHPDGPPEKVSEGRRNARSFVPNLALPKEQATEVIRDRCVLVLARLVTLTQNSALAERLIPSAYKVELREAMKRELSPDTTGERLKNLLVVINFVKSPEAVTKVVTVFRAAVDKEDWRLVGATMTTMDGSMDPRVRRAYLDAYRKLYAKDRQPDLCARLLTNVARIGLDRELLGLATPAIAAGQPDPVRQAGLQALGAYARAEPLLQKKAATALENFIKSEPNVEYRMRGVEALTNYKNKLGLKTLQSVREKLALDASNKKLLEKIDAAIEAINRGGAS